MAKDYAKRIVRQEEVKKPWGRWVIVLIAVVIVFSLSFYITKEKLQGKEISTIFQQMTVIFKHKKMFPPAAAIKESSEPDIHFDFYTELPHAQVMASPSIAQAPLNKPSVMPVQNNLPPPAYVLQVASFPDKISASEYRISLILAGFDADIVKINNANQVLFWVQQGPFATADKAKIAQQKLAKKGIKSNIQKL